MLKTNYYLGIQKFIKFPFTFVAIVGNKSDSVYPVSVHIFSILKVCFQSMVECNGKSLAVVYQQSEDLFQRLLKVKDIFQDWVTLGSIDIDAFIEENIKEVDDWEVTTLSLALLPS